MRDFIYHVLKLKRRSYEEVLQTLFKIIFPKLRKNIIKLEVKLWARIRREQINNLQFYRQKPLGKYIVDFYCPAKRIVIEVDGCQHYEDRNIYRDKKT